ncbi:hypothetical protein TW83_16270 [Paracoccus sp. S4493]|uniref:MAE_28990/MAE_18760 family HEPN-like nuclease n=1 Tax=Paracoccus sp. S4493 TaxID=579490 RepID=UPI0005FA7A95|nr:MAE_28990/MAE_18760 family HEPN-like nuclease [Paracoccus sp. S4493]KJZ30134.1 hypothetical protein TW83_16270 [Paracoccus sp. S4493]
MELTSVFDERLDEITAYLNLLQAIEVETQNGPPRIGATGAHITAQQQKILYSGIFLHLYNLVEATVVRCLEAVTVVALTSHSPAPSELTDEMKKEWVRVMARTHIELSSDNRLVAALRLCDHLVQKLPVAGFEMEKGGGGNWDDDAIQSVAERLGLRLRVSRESYTGIKRKFRDDLGALALIKKRRNQLAHGSLSFAECGEGLTVTELRDLVNRTVAYLQEVIAEFQNYIEAQHYLAAHRQNNVA